MDALIFDIDGTLWDSREAVAHAWSDSITRHTGRERLLTVEEISPLFGQTMDVIVAYLFPNETPERRSSLGRLCLEEENTWLQHEPGILYPDVAQTLEVLHRRMPLFILSNCQCGYIEVLLQTTGLARFFDGHICFGDTNLDKAENLKILCQRHQLHAPVYVGDTQGDADACQRAGIAMIYASYGFGTVNAPWKTIKSFSELIDIV